MGGVGFGRNVIEGFANGFGWIYTSGAAALVSAGYIIAIILRPLTSSLVCSTLMWNTNRK